MFLDSRNRDTTEEKADDETVEEGEPEGEGNCKETQRKSKSRRKPKSKKHLPEEGTEIGAASQPTVTSSLYATETRAI